MKTVVEYTQRDDISGFWIDVKADGVEREPIGPFSSPAQRQAAYDDLLSMMRTAGAIDLPSFKQ